MIKLLIVEDRPEKLQKIAAEIKSVSGVRDENIYVAECVNSARRLISQVRFDLLLLDMHLPTHLGEEPRMDAGLELLQSIGEGGRYKPPFHIIAVTAFEEAQRLSERMLELHLWSTLVYEENSSTWKEPLKNKIKYLIESKNSLLSERINTSSNMLAIVTALSEELEGVKGLMVEIQERRRAGDPTTYYEGFFRNEGKSIPVVAATSNRMGMAASSSLTMKIVDLYRPKYIAMAGIAAGIPGKTSLGDVLIADPSWDWGAGKFEVIDGVGKFSADPEQLRIDPMLRGQLASAAGDEQLLYQVRAEYGGPRVVSDLRSHIGGIASGAAVIGDGKVVESIQNQKRKMIGVEMEIYGVMVAVDSSSEPRPLAFSAKSVSDYADTDKDDSNRHYAVYTSAAFIRKFATKYLADA